MVKLEFSGWKVLAEIGAVIVISPFFILFKLEVFNYFGWNNDVFALSLISYAILWRFIREWAKFYRWTQEHDWSS